MFIGNKHWKLYYLITYISIILVFCSDFHANIILKEMSLYPLF